jgi:hypothetical protein
MDVVGKQGQPLCVGLRVEQVCLVNQPLVREEVTLVAEAQGVASSGCSEGFRAEP